MTPTEIGLALDELNLALGRYMVALAGAFQRTHYDGIPSGKPSFFCFPGFVFAIGQRQLFVTAGHNMEALKSEYGDRYNEWTGMAWVHFVPHSGSGHVLSIDNSSTRRIELDCDVKEGRHCERASGTCDFGTLELTEKEWQWMDAAGVKAFHVEDVKTVYNSAGYVLIGLPTALFDEVKINQDNETTAVTPTIISLAKRNDLIEATDGLWFIGDLPDEAKLDIRGMSGGPLFAINWNSWEVWIAGVQSNWCPTRRLAFVCPINTILERLLANQ